MPDYSVITVGETNTLIRCLLNSDSPSKAKLASISWSLKHFLTFTQSLALEPS